MSTMSLEFPSQPEPLLVGAESSALRPEDVAIEAIVYDVHPALIRKRQAATAYPYGPPPKNVGYLPAPIVVQTTGESPFQVRPQDIYRPRPTPLFQFDLAEAKVDYVVPQRFGLAAILGMTTALAILFGCMRWLDAHPVWYLFFGLQSIVICIVQMFQGRSPRRASAVAGAIMGPLFLLGTAWFAWRDSVDGGVVLCLTVMMIPTGAFLGYLNGTCAAGIFLVMDKLENYLKGDSASENEPEGPLSSPAVPAS